jgi:hypothetical protein
VTCEQVRESAAVRLLTGGPPDPEVEAHLADCDLCSAQVARLAPLPDLLASAASQVDLLDAPTPGDAMLERLLAAAAAERRSRRMRLRRIAAAGVAAAALLAVPTAVVVAHHGSGQAQQDSVSATAANPATGISGHVELARSSWGSEMTLKVTGVQEGTSCTVVVVTKDGSKQTAATWWAQYPGPATVNGTVAADVPAIARVDLVDSASGEVLLALPLHA